MESYLIKVPGIYEWIKRNADRIKEVTLEKAKSDMTLIYPGHNNKFHGFVVKFNELINRDLELNLSYQLDMKNGYEKLYASTLLEVIKDGDVMRGNEFVVKLVLAIFRNDKINKCLSDS